MFRPHRKIRAVRKAFFALYFRKPLPMERFDGPAGNEPDALFGEHVRAVNIVRDDAGSRARRVRLAFGPRRKKSQWLMEIAPEFLFASCWTYTGWEPARDRALGLFRAALDGIAPLALDGVQHGVTDLFENDAPSTPLTDAFLPESCYLPRTYLESDGRFSLRLSLRRPPLCGRSSPYVATLDIHRSAARKASWLLPDQLHVRHTQSVDLHDDTPLLTTSELSAGQCSVVSRLFTAMHEENTVLLRGLLQPHLLQKLGLAHDDASCTGI